MCMAILFRHYQFNPFLTLLVCLFAYLLFKLGFEGVFYWYVLHSLLSYEVTNSFVHRPNLYPCSFLILHLLVVLIYQAFIIPQI